MFAVKTEKGMTAVIAGDKEGFEEDSSIVKATVVPSSLTDEEDCIRIKAEEENWMLKRNSELQSSNHWRRCA